MAAGRVVSAFSATVPVMDAQPAMTPTVSTALASVVDQFAADHAHLADPAQAREVCVETSEAFVAVCLSAGLPAKIVTGAQFGETPEFPGVRLLLHGHTAALVGDGDHDWIYDWTARQFDPAAEFPAVMTVEQWREEWVHPDHW